MVSSLKKIPPFFSNKGIHPDGLTKLPHAPLLKLISAELQNEEANLKRKHQVERP